jgi:hypothetical protein
MTGFNTVAARAGFGAFFGASSPSLFVALPTSDHRRAVHGP